MKTIFAIICLSLAFQCLATIIPHPAINAYHVPSANGFPNSMVHFNTGRFGMSNVQVYPNAMNRVNPGHIEMSKDQLHSNPMVHTNVAPMAPGNFGVTRATANLESNQECTSWWGSYTFWGWTRLTFHCYGSKTCEISIAAGITGKERLQVDPGKLKTIERQWAGALYQVCNVGYSAFSVVTN